MIRLLAIAFSLLPTFAMAFIGIPIRTHDGRLLAASTNPPSVQTWIDTNAASWYVLYDAEQTNATGMLDISGNNIHMTNYPSMSAGATYTQVCASPVKHAWYLEAAKTNYMIANQAVLNGKTQFTTMVWCKKTNKAQSYGILLGDANSAQGMNSIEFDGSANAIGIEVTRSGGYALSRSSSSFPTNVWKFCAFRFRSGTASLGELYIDGVYVTNLAMNAAVYADKPLRIGIYGEFLNRLFDGWWAWGGISSNYLSLDAMNDIMNHTSPTNFYQRITP